MNKTTYLPTLKGASGRVGIPEHADQPVDAPWNYPPAPILRRQNSLAGINTT